MKPEAGLLLPSTTPAAPLRLPPAPHERQGAARSLRAIYFPLWATSSAAHLALRPTGCPRPLCRAGGSARSQAALRSRRKLLSLHECMVADKPPSEHSPDRDCIPPPPPLLRCELAHRQLALNQMPWFGCFNSAASPSEEAAGRSPAALPSHSPGGDGQGSLAALHPQAAEVGRDGKGREGGGWRRRDPLWGGSGTPTPAGWDAGLGAVPRGMLRAEHSEESSGEAAAPQLPAPLPASSKKKKKRARKGPNVTIFGHDSAPALP